MLGYRLVGFAAFGAIVSGAVSGTAAAQDQNRFSMEKSAGGYVRMDRQTGKMSLCEEKGGQLICRLAADERAAFEDDIERLQDAIHRMEKRLTALENAPSVPQAVIPSQEEFEKSLGYMELFLRRFMGIVKELDSGPTDEGSAQKT